MIEATIVALSPFVLNFIMSVSKWLPGVQTTAGKRFLLAVLSIFGVVGFNALNGTPVDANSISSLTTIVLEALAAFLMSHGSYQLFWQATPEAVPFTETTA